MAKRRRQASLRISWLETNSSNGIGWFLVHIPPGERKSGIPHSVEIPAPGQPKGRERKPIKVGVSNGSRTEVLDGLSEKQQIILQ